MAKKMLIDATHEEETRVAIVENDRLEEYDYESAFRKALKGNIYLAKVTRVEPSLQAAFVNFGGNRHGFLPFSEIHPDYFRIPVADREALMAAQEEELKEHDAAAAKEDAKEEDGDSKNKTDNSEEKSATKTDEKPKPKPRSRRKKKDESEDAKENVKKEEEAQAEDSKDEPKEKPKSRSRRKKAVPKDESKTDSTSKKKTKSSEADGNILAPDPVEEDDVDGNTSSKNTNSSKGRGRGGRGRTMQNRNREAEVVDKGSNDHDDEKRFRYNLRRKYKIQEVIKRGQIMLIQVSKEERGNKGAAVGSYLSLPGRYCVLMPNSPRSGGVSRKIANYKDRAKMRDMLKEIDVPKGMSVIMRTAGVTRTKTEIKRDLDYLLRLWDKIRELTMESTAPALVYEEADLIKRAVRDLYTKDVEEIIVSGEKGHKNAKDFMKMMIPSHVKRITEYKDPIPLFNKYRVENQINEMSQPTATMKSGGYLVINPTEALVSIDVNSGKATKERHIEGTALKTNLEAADEVARQLRLRDLGGLIVIDFIDMERSGNNGKVERRLKEALAGDRARIQVGRISSFGLMEMSRQRMNPSITEAQFETCPHCEGTGNIRTPDATSVLVIRTIEEEGIKGRAAQLIVHVTTKVALYILNGKRMHLSDLEDRYKLDIAIRIDDTLAASDFRIEVAKPSEKGEQDNSERGNNRNRNNNNRNNNNNDDEGKEGSNARRRGRRGGRNRNRNRDENQDNNSKNDNAASKDTQETSQAESLNGEDKQEASRSERPNGKDEKEASRSERENGKDDKPKRGRRPAAKKSDEDVKQDTAQTSNDQKPEDKPKEEPKKRTSRAKKATEGDKATDAPAKKQAAPSNDEESTEPSHASNFETVNEAPKKKKKGWWSKG